MVFLNSCEAPRENPLDPNSNDNLLGTIDGTVQTFSLPYTPIKNVEVFWKPGNILVYSDTGGNFIIPNVKTENGTLIFRKEGYHTDTVEIDWAGARKITEQINLNKIPMLDSLSVYSVIINSANPPVLMSELVIKTKIIDVDNDIDTVSVVNEKQGLDKAMDFNIASKTFQTVLTPEELNITDIEQSIGLEFDFRVRDVLGEIYMLHGDGVNRVIKDQVTGLQPANDQQIPTVPFNLQWDSFTPGYSFHYMVEIYTNDGSQLVFRKDSISSGENSFNITTMNSGSYWWAIWIIDEFNDMSRSLPATFIVQ
jgi:hypothetical protein